MHRPEVQKAVSALFIALAVAGPFLLERGLMAQSATGVCGWPLVPSRRFPGETTLACPKCGSLDVTMTIRPGAYGTGPGNSWRIGDQGGHDLNVCNVCRHTSDGYKVP